ncbi:N-acetyltransferase [Rahnella aquatilis]|uniref:N-acetyltransferase n=1 Tax=Rahnella perminowiae TaxID=2816244 RepID=A0ABS6L0F2_9GAMM|nr:MULTISPECIES: N-acetyltransferase [Rahnella]MBU9825662.1 N-acetyltransferase [Rahnella perminowiae]MBU9835188.1 N-acetyltransferase [Rahnella perminowiae]MCX2942612.1 N-acetyltransferase [Rahnella perminowiae]UJD87832.1 N-acetyltransferase [Rahnella aquatilis]
MLIRTEIPVDAAGIDRLLRASFPTGAEADLVQELREDGLLTLGVVATDDEGGVVGYVAFCPVDIQGEDRNWVALAPLAVEHSLRGQGLGEKLVYEGLDSLNEFGYAAVVVLGDPAYYKRFGFQPAAAHGLHCRWTDTETMFQLFTLADDALSDASGEVVFPSAFNRF